MANADVLYRTFELYLKQAKENEARGELYLAKKHYMSAAEQMLKLAKECKGDLQRTRYERAKSLLARAQSLGVPESPKSETAPSDKEGAQTEPQPITLEQAMESLNALEGLHATKEQVERWVATVQSFLVRRQSDKAVPPMSFHMAFVGNPGTGKTTVARIVAQICYALGIVQSSTLVEVSRADMVAGYVGQTAIKTREVLERAKNGVLFIDEAYDLVRNNDTDFGKEAVAELVKEMENNRSSMVVIIAGYEEDIQEFICSNKGFPSRFRRTIKFEDYTSEELYRIFDGMCQRYQYRLADETEPIMKQYFDALYATRDKTFANARDVRNLFEDIVEKQSCRIAKIENVSSEEMEGILPLDLPDTVFEKIGKK